MSNPAGQKIRFTEFDEAFLVELEEKWKQSGLTQHEFCQLLGISPPSFSYYIRRKRSPVWWAVAHMAKQLKINLNALVKSNSNKEIKRKSRGPMPSGLRRVYLLKGK